MSRTIGYILTLEGKPAGYDGTYIYFAGGRTAATVYPTRRAALRAIRESQKWSADNPAGGDPPKRYGVMRVESTALPNRTHP